LLQGAFFIIVLLKKGKNAGVLVIKNFADVVADAQEPTLLMTYAK